MIRVEGFKEFIFTAKRCKEEYNSIPCAFFHMQDYLNERRKYKEMIYSIPCKKNEKYKRDICWCYMNGDIEYNEMICILTRQ